MSYPFDSKLNKRIKEYMTENPYTDASSLAEELKKLFPRDYGRRKTNPFRLQSESVITSLRKSGELPSLTPLATKKKSKNKNKFKQQQQQESDDDNIDDVDEETLVEYKNTNSLNKMITSLYKKPNGETPTGTPIKLSTEAENYDKYDDSLIVMTTPSATADMQLVQIVDEAAAGDNNEVEKSQISDFQTPNGGDASMRLSRLKGRKRKKNSALKNKSKKLKPSDGEEEDGDVFNMTNKPPAFEVEECTLTFDDVGGNEGIVRELGHHLLHLKQNKIFTTLGVSPSCGILLHGPPGCGKTLIGKAIAGHLGLPLLYLSGPEVIASMSGESEKRVRELFQTAQDNSPCILFLDEIDAIGQKRENATKEMERRIITQMITCMDNMNKDKPILVVGATSKPESLDPGLRRAGRFDKEISVGIPNESGRQKILEILCRKMKLADDVDFRMIAHLTPGFVGADLESLCREAADPAVLRILKNKFGDKYDFDEDSNELIDFLKNNDTIDGDEVEGLSITYDDFNMARKRIQPSAKREGFATVPEVTWNDIGALEGVREELTIAILGPVHNPKMFDSYGLSQACGILLAGPPGCGKTLLAKAVANEAGINFISVKGPELLNMYVGESERAVRQCFERARNSSPCVIFFDEFDSLCPRRSSSENKASTRVVNQMLTELDGLESRKQVFVIAATNRLDIIDPAVLRPGRLDKTLYVGIPSAEDRVKILQTITKNGSKPPISDDVCFRQLGHDDRCTGFSGADLSALIREASLNALRDQMKGHEWSKITADRDTSTKSATPVSQKNISDAFDKIKPSISNKDHASYEKMQRNLTS